MNTKTISTIQAKQVCDGSHYLTLSAVNPVVIFDIEGEIKSTTGTAYYVQLLSTASPSTGVTIPLWSRLAVPASYASGINGFSFTYRPGGLDTSTMTDPAGGTIATDGTNTLPVYVAISSTDNVYTTVAASMQVTIEVEETNLEVANQTVTGDTTTGVDHLVVFADPNPSKMLVQITAANSAATPSVPMYLMLFAYASPATGATPIMQWQFKGTASLTFNFGRGKALMQYTNSPYTLHTGCYLYGSSTTGTFTATSATAWNIKAWNV